MNDSEAEEFAVTRQASQASQKDTACPLTSSHNNLPAAKSDAPMLREEDFCSALKSVQASKSCTPAEIRRYIQATNDKFSALPKRRLEAQIKQVAAAGVQRGTVTKSKHGFRYRLASFFRGQKKAGSKRRRACGRCRQHRQYRPYCSRYKRRCCRRRCKGQIKKRAKKVKKARKCGK